MREQILTQLDEISMSKKKKKKKKRGGDTGTQRASAHAMMQIAA
jgi:hypothetical protein